MILNKIFKRQSKGIFRTDNEGFILWDSYSEQIQGSEFMDFQQTTIKQNIYNLLKRAKQGVSSFSYFFKSIRDIGQYPKIYEVKLK